jgi:hypothetical protein
VQALAERPSLALCFLSDFLRVMREGGQSQRGAPRTSTKLLHALEGALQALAYGIG